VSLRRQRITRTARSLMPLLMREPTTKDFAEYFRLALEASLCRENEVESWADKMIAETSAPIPGWLLNLSTESQASKSTLLQEVPGEADLITTWSLLPARFGGANRAKQFSPEQIVKVLFRWAASGEMPKPFISKACQLDAGFDGMEAGWYSEVQFTKDFEDFFRQFRSFEPYIPQSAFQVLR